MNSNSDFEALVGRISEIGYDDLARMEAEARRLRAQAMRYYMVQAFRWLTGSGRRAEPETVVRAAPRHA